MRITSARMSRATCGHASSEIIATTWGGTGKRENHRGQDEARDDLESRQPHAQQIP
jgi:hypothetical protein